MDGPHLPAIADRARSRLVDEAGGPARIRVIATLAAVLALDTADKGAISAVAVNLEDALSVGRTRIGLLLTVSGFVAAAGTLGFGILVDRIDRTRLLTVVVLLWAAAMVGGAAAPGYWWLLASRAALGLLAAAAYPAVSSLVGDWFPTRDRSRVLGMVLAGELAGTGFGVVTAGLTASLLGWRAAFVVLAVPAIGVAWLLARTPEPARGGAARLDRGQDELAPADESLEAEGGAPPRRQPTRHRSTRKALRTILTIRTNLALILASSLAYYLFAGVRAFGVDYATGHYGLRQGIATILIVVVGLGGLVGVIAGGRLADRLLAAGFQDARMVVPAVALIAAGLVFVPAVITTSALVAMPLLMVAAAFVGVSSPPSDAARLDVVPSALWGRAEGARTIVRTGLEGVAPLAFGAVAQHVFGSKSSSGLEPTFLVMLVPLGIGSAVLLLARGRYVADRDRAAEDDQIP
jgi:predicted MFS family arabinose efflux permease